MDLKTHIIEAFRNSEKNLNGKADLPLHQLQKEALSRFEALGFPTPKHEEWKYSNVASLLKNDFVLNAKSDFSAENISHIALPNLTGNVLYFVNGVYKADLSQVVSGNDKISVLSFKEALEKNPALIDKYFGKIANGTEEAFTAMNTAMPHDGVVIQIADNQVVEEPIILRFITDVREVNVATQPRNLIVAGKRSEVKIAEAYRTIGDKVGFTNAVTEIFLDEAANVQYYKVQDESDSSYHVGTTQVIQSSHSYFYSSTVSINGGFIRNNLNLILDGEYCDGFMYGLYVPNGRQHIDNHTMVDHRKPNSQSNELYKGILMDKSTGVFNGKIFVREDAQKTNAYQNCRNVIVSNEATMNTKPQLEIWADDVKCSHGTTTGQLNDEAVFYMQSRGIPKPEAKRLLMLAFAEDVVSNIKIDSIREYLEAKVLEKLGE
jgi:Fe-S cluster assembly protein SufD